MCEMKLFSSTGEEMEEMMVRIELGWYFNDHPAYL